MNWPKLLVFVRHAEAEGNIISSDERVLLERPSPDFSLTERGKKQAMVTGEYVRERFGNFDAYFHSYYDRAKQTLKLMYPEARGIEDARLAERQGGIWHSLTEERLID